MDLYTSIIICSMFHANAITNAIIENGSHENPLAVTVVTQVGQPGTTKSDFKTSDEAIAYAKQQLASGNHVEVGMMQIPSGWFSKLTEEGTSMDELFKPCKNIAVATDLLNQAESYCALLTDDAAQQDQCALSFYKTGDPKLGIAYAQQIISYGKNNPLKPNPLPPAMTQNVDYKAFIKSAGLDLPAPTFNVPASDDDQQTDTKQSGANDVESSS